MIDLSNLWKERKCIVILFAHECFINVNHIYTRKRQRKKIYNDEKTVQVENLINRGEILRRRKKNFVDKALEKNYHWFSLQTYLINVFFYTQ